LQSSGRRNGDWHKFDKEISEGNPDGSELLTGSVLEALMFSDNLVINFQLLPDIALTSLQIKRLNLVL